MPKVSSPPPPDAPARVTAPPSALLTALIWTASLGALAGGGVIASLFVMMPVSLDIGEMIAAGADPWRYAAYAAIGFCLLFVASVVALALWHRSRERRAARLAAWAIAAAEVGVVAVGGAMVMRDWF